MTYSQLDPAAQNQAPWKFGAKIGPKRPFDQKQIWAIRFFLDREERIRIARCLTWRLIASFAAAIS